MADKIFADGVFFKLPHDKAPKFVKGNISINVEKFGAFMTAQVNERGWINLDIKESKNGSIYVELNTYQSGQQKAQPAQTTQPKEKTFADKLAEPTEIPVIEENNYPESEDNINVKDIPF